MAKRRWQKIVSPDSPGAFGAQEGRLELRACCLVEGAKAAAPPAPSERSTLCCSVSGGPPLAIGRLSDATPHCRLRTHLQSDAVLTCSKGELLIVGFLWPPEDAPPAKAAKTATGESVREATSKAQQSKLEPKAAQPKAEQPKATAAQPKAQQAAPKAAQPKAAEQPKPKAVSPKAAQQKPKAAQPQAAQPKPKAAQPQAPVARKRLGSGLEYEVLKPGSGQIAKPGNQVKVRYEGRLASNGKRFDKGVIAFRLGMGEVIRGWDEGVRGMLRGEQRRLMIPARLGYGSRGAPPAIPGNAALIFEVELLQL